MIRNDLLKLEADGNPIRIGVSGAGWIGSGFIAQVAHMPGMRVDVVADTDLTVAREAFLSTGIQDEDILEADTPAFAMDALIKGKKVITPLYELASQLEAVDIVADVTPSPAIGAITAAACIQNQKDVVMVNIEADVTVGRILHRLANQAGCLYSVSSGDEPGCLAELWEYVNLLGFEPIAIGKGKNNPLDVKATPDSVAESANKSGKDAFTVASYVDGTKTMFEMACAANATGCLPMKRGMVGPEATLQNVNHIFSLKEDGGIVEFPGVVDFVQGSAMSGGVFITVRIHDERLAADLQYLKVGKGKYATIFRPYHLWFIEAPISVATAYLKREKWLVPLDRPVAEVLTIAKRDLHPGDVLDVFGGYTFYGMIDRAEIASEMHALPVGLAPGARLINTVAAGEVLRWEDVRLDEDSMVVRLRREQDALKSTII